ncbi:hypothetical protein ACFVXW_05300 [Streptomyces sp. NPDC058251]|uniref:hypothetical protein n=1 Tax=Streptomyces sp. NPDC058251 TaxID=3346404 RepID=UPI0036F100F0
MRINLYVRGDFYRGVAVAHYDEAGGRRAYDLRLWPQPGESPRGIRFASLVDEVYTQAVSEGPPIPPSAYFSAVG